MSSTPDAASTADVPADPTASFAFATWVRTRPFVGGLLVVLSGIEMFFSGQLDFGHIHLQFGIQGFQAMVIPVVLVLLGVLVWTMPVHRVFYGVIALVLSVYSLIGVNLGGFFIGTILGIVGGVVSVSWLPREATDEASGAATADDRSTGSTAPTEPEDDYSLVPGFDAAPDAAPTAPAPTGDEPAAPAAEPLAPVAAIAEPSSPPTLTLHTAETASDDTPSGPRPFPDASAEADAAPEVVPAPATSRRGRRLTRATGAAVVVVCAAAGVGAVNAAQAPTANAATQASVPVPTFLRWLVPGSSDDAATPEAAATGSAPSSTATGADTAGAAAVDTPTTSPSKTTSTDAADGTTDATPSADDGEAAPAPSPSASASASPGTSTTTSPPANPTPTSPIPAATTPAPKLAATTSMPVAPALLSHLEGSTLDLTNAHFVGNVTLQRADGSTVQVMKFTTDKTVIDDFSLDVPNGDGHGLLTTSSKVTNTGHVVLYATRLEGYLLGFKFTFKPSTPPPTIIPLPSLSDPRIELVATTSDSSSWSNAHQSLY